MGHQPGPALALALALIPSPSHGRDTEHQGLRNHNFMIYVLLGGLLCFLLLILLTLVCLSQRVITRYLAARRLLLKAAQYRPGKYKQVSPSLTATPALAALQSIYTLEDRPSSTNTT